MTNLEAAIVKKFRSIEQSVDMPSVEQAAAQAALEFFEQAYKGSFGDFDYVMFVARQEYTNE